MKNILLIGGSHGIGLSMVKELQETHNVFVASRTDEQLQHENITHIEFDVTKDELDISQLPEKLDGFVYCPGSINLKPFKMMSLDTIKDDMELNFFAMVKIVKQIISLMNDDSSMVFFSTIAVGTGMPFHTSVAAAKGAIEGFAKSMAAEYAPKLRVNVIAPSLVDTPLAKRLLNNDKKREMMSDRHPLKRVGNPEDIANAAVFLLSDKSTWMTGQIIGVDGGLSTLNVN
ncbi:NAD(P)-dependent dehydrogenase (short-subunit alcohol dehydrogenase family) [Maribacter spongiicola]|uniref:NAD(P)-dependent dehydrogenase (Short-subunit alcohol dehydrogenase family) n=1 Tax=Maribacter spongiicola TaxID=1206753 RepID=A0A4R7K2J2_9FLAO|nr:SDR family oxidoreductase [Maribacter spongiicola]TDT45060.1 NAD(P)-dependent dehydrogenase (short-subunit alcohol dehydrogenase family) [Maribacter spongiicola]